jgi:hypothetical protein
MVIFVLRPPAQIFMQGCFFIGVMDECLLVWKHMACGYERCEQLFTHSFGNSRAVAVDRMHRID